MVNTLPTVQIAELTLRELMADNNLINNPIMKPNVDDDGNFYIYLPQLNSTEIKEVQDGENFKLEVPSVMNETKLICKPTTLVYRTIIPHEIIKVIQFNQSFGKYYYNKLFNTVTEHFKNKHGIGNYDMIVCNSFVSVIRPDNTIFRETSEGYEIRFYSSAARLKDFK